MRKLKIGQQEMVGFVLIVVLVMIALIVFLIISVGKKQEIRDNVEVENLLGSLMRYTTDCAIVYEPDYSDVEELIKDCKDLDRCTNLNKESCDYLNETLTKVMDSLIASEASISAYEFSVQEKESEERIFYVRAGNCTGQVSGGQQLIPEANGQGILVRLNVCLDV